VLLDFGAPDKVRLPVGQEHGRTIPLRDITAVVERTDVGPAHPLSAAIRPLTAIVIIALAACHNAPAIYQDRDCQGRMKSARPSSVGCAQWREPVQ
jgi:hypothetical protein